MKTHTSKTLIDNTRGLRFTESPRWHDGKLWFLDIHDKRIKTADLGGRVETAVELPFIPNAFGHRRDGSLLVGDAMQRQIHRWDRVRGGRSPRLPTEPCVRVRTRLLTQGVSTDSHQTSAVTACQSEWLVPAPQ
jgi:sugar lactone lactonase YvrE